MKLTVLADNNTYIDRYLLGEPAVSYYIEDQGVRLLFDTGYSDVYVKNGEALGLDLSGVDVVVLSHGHDDHTGGLDFFPAGEKRPRLICHPGALEKKRVGDLEVCARQERTALSERFRLEPTREPVRVSPHILYLGEIPRTTPFENRRPIGQRLAEAGWEPDFLADDSALAYEAPEGVYVITGCSHAGICNIIRWAKQVTGRDRVLGVIGGFHLMEGRSEQLDRTVEYLKGEDIPQLYPCHCTCFEARAAIHRECPVREVGVGLTVQW